LIGLNILLKIQKLKFNDKQNQNLKFKIKNITNFVLKFDFEFRILFEIYN